MSPMINDPMSPIEMYGYGCTTTKRGRALIAKIMAAKMPLTLTRTMVGSGTTSFRTWWSRWLPLPPMSPCTTATPFT